MKTRVVQPYTHGALGGVLLGLVVLVSFVVSGRGIGASGAFADAAAKSIEATAPALLDQSPALADRLSPATPLLDSWIVWQVFGLIVGGALSAWWSGRQQRGESLSRSRLVRAAMGGVLMGIGARLAYGCTSGLALSGGAVLATGAFVFIPAAFVTAILVTLSVRGTVGES